MIMAWRHRERWLNIVYVGDDIVEDEKGQDAKSWVKPSWETGTEENTMSQSIIPSSRQHVRVPIRRVITPICALRNLIWQAVPLVLISAFVHHIVPNCMLQCSFSSSTLSSYAEHNAKSSLHISPCHYHDLIPSKVYTEYSIQLRLSVLPSFQQL